MASDIRPYVLKPTVYGGLTPPTQWYEYPSGLVDLSRPAGGISRSGPGAHDGPPMLHGSGCFELAVEGGRRVRVSAGRTAVVVVDMQNFFLLPELRQHPEGLAAVAPILALVRHLRPLGVQVVWLNWSMTPTSPTHLPPALERDFIGTAQTSDPAHPGPRAGFGTFLGPGLGRLLVEGEGNTRMYGPLQEEYERCCAKDGGEGDVWVGKDRMSGLWGRGSELERVLQKAGRTTLFIAGINADQCVTHTIAGAYSLGYDLVAVEDCIGTTSPAGGKAHLMYNMLHEYGFVTDTRRVLEASVA